MMIDLIAAVAAAGMVLPFNTSEVEVHEWGVVRFDSAGITAQGVPPGEYSSVGPMPFEYGAMPPLVDAPVIFFHGSGFTGDMEVSIPDGRPTEVYPEEGMSITGCTIEWKGIEVRESYPLCTDAADRRGLSNFVWENSVHLWRGVDANTVILDGGLEEGFLYYECAMSPLAALEYPGLLARGRGLPEGVEGVLMFLRPDGDLQEMYMVPPQRIFLPVEVDEIGCYGRERVIGILQQWAGTRLNEDEVQVMWDTWEGFVTSGEWDGDALLLFPLPEETVESISTLSLRTDQDLEVTCHRFFLGMVPVNW